MCQYYSKGSPGVRAGSVLVPLTKRADPGGLFRWVLCEGEGPSFLFGAERAVSAESEIPRKARGTFFRLRPEVSDGQGRCPCTLPGSLDPGPFFTA